MSEKIKQSAVERVNIAEKREQLRFTNDADMRLSIVHERGQSSKRWYESKKQESPQWVQLSRLENSQQAERYHSLAGIVFAS